MEMEINISPKSPKISTVTLKLLASFPYSCGAGSGALGGTGVVVVFVCIGHHWCSTGHGASRGGVGCAGRASSSLDFKQVAVNPQRDGLAPLVRVGVPTVPFAAAPLLLCAVEKKNRAAQL